MSRRSLTGRSSGLAAVAAVCAACGASSMEGDRSTDGSGESAAVPPEARAVATPSADGGPSPADDSGASAPDGVDDAAGVNASDAAQEAASGLSEAGEGGLSADRFVTGVVSFTPGPCAGFGASAMPGIVEGPPKGGGATQGSLDVVSLGVAGEIVVSFAPNAIVDGPGADFIVFENAFYIGGNPQKPYAEPGEVSVSDDGTTWATYPCTATSYPYGQCAGWHAVFSAPGNGISPVDPATAGGESYDLADVGLTHARFVRIRDKSSEVCPDAGGPNTDGFDLDAVSIVNAESP
jgi:hypothetical protein